MGGPYEPLRQFGAFISKGRVHLLLGQEEGKAQICAPKIATLQVRTTQVCVFKNSFTQIGPCQIRTAQVTAHEAQTLEFSATDDSMTEISISESSDSYVF